MNEVPPLKELFNPTLDAIKALGGSARNNEIRDQVITDLNIPDRVTDVLHKSGYQTVLEYQLAWARSWLKNYGLLENPQRGIWSLTSAGRATSQVDPGEVISSYQRTKPNSDDRDGKTPNDDDGVEGAEPWRSELLRVLREMDHRAFEQLCRRLLRESGFIEVKVTGGSGDGGIDGHGIIRLADLISFPVMFQCKRYSSNVPAKEIRDFRGAMQGRSEKGLFFTTSDFTQDARKEATRSGAPLIDLINGKDLTDLLVKLKLGVKPTSQVVKAEVDKSYFQSI